MKTAEPPSNGSSAGPPGADDPASPPARNALSTGELSVLLGLVTGVQGLSTFSVLALPTLATKAAPAFGFGAEAVGYQISVVYIAAALMSGIAGLYVRRHGAALASLWSLGLGIVGLLGIASGNFAFGLLASILIGVAYGLTNPAASHLLFRFAPPKRQNLIFALKQTGVPLGGLLAASLLPTLSEAIGWQGAIAASALLLLLLAVPLALMRPRLDDDRAPKAQLVSGLLSGVQLVLGDPALRAFAIMGFAYASAQFCLFTFMITMLVQDFHWSLVAAGAVTSLMQIGGVAGRIAWSLLADRIGHGMHILMTIGVLSTAFAVALAMADPAWPAVLLTCVLIGFGFCLIGWNGLWLAEIARTCRPDQVSFATGGVLVFTFSGIVLGPAMFATLYKVLGSYTLTYGAFGIFPLIGAAALAAAIRRRR